METMGTVLRPEEMASCKATMTPEQYKQLEEVQMSAATPMPSLEEIQRRDLEYRRKLASRTSHDIARELLALPEKRLVFVRAAGGPYTQDFHASSTAWDADCLGEIRIMISDETEACSKVSG